MRQVRARAGAILMGIAACISLTAAAQLPVYVTPADMRVYVWTVLASVAVGTVLVGAGLLAWIMRRDRTLQQSSIDLVIAATERLAGQIEAAIDALERHNADPFSHTAAAEHHHEPMTDQTQRIEEKLDALLIEHRIIHGLAGRGCVALQVLQERDPMDSQKPHRADDVGDDYRALRGRQ
jgi:hypothetical protein